MIFVGRERESAELERLYQTGSFQMLVMYGRWRVGKTTLISRFATNKWTVYFTAIESDSVRNLELFSKAVMKTRNIISDISFSTWDAAFTEVARLAAGEQLVLVIDEYPYLAQAERSVSSLLQNYCDHAYKTLPLMIILCGSSMSFMEEQVLGYQSPLYGRQTAQMKIMPFGYRDSAAFVPAYSQSDKAIVYGITGGIPKYLELFDDSRSLKKNIISNFFTSSGYLYEEPSNLLKQELREPIKYNRIIEAIARGASRLNEIATKSGLDTAAAANYTSALIALGIIQKETAITEEKNKRKTLYRIGDSMFLFWYRYVQGNDFAIVTGDTDSLYETEIKPDLSRFMGYIFETICAEYLGVINGKDGLPFKIRELGRWWGSNPLTKAEEEIDLVGINSKLSSALFCECKYKEQMADSSVLRVLKAKADLWRGYEHKYYMLFSKRGFTKELHAEVTRLANVYLVNLADMYQ